MSRSRLIDRGTEKLTLYPDKTVANSKGTELRVPDYDSGVDIRVTVTTGRQSDASLENGQVSVMVLNVLCRNAPVGSWCAADFRGLRWDIAEPPVDSRATRATKHIEFTIRSRNQVAQ